MFNVESFQATAQNILAGKDLNDVIPRIEAKRFYKHKI
jgi:hypothetical protein